MKQSPLEDVWPLSPLQQGLLFHALYDQQAVDVYTVQFVFDLAGPVDAAALNAVGQALLDRHATLRAAFRYPRSGVPVAVIARLGTRLAATGRPTARTATGRTSSVPSTGRRPRLIACTATGSATCSSTPTPARPRTRPSPS